MRGVDKCWRCDAERVERHYLGRVEARCECFHDWRTPMERRSDEILDTYGSDPAAFDGAVLAQLANGPIYRAHDHYCPAGKLSMAETKAREAAAVEVK